MKRGEEYSAGGVVTREGKVLLIRMKTLGGELVWTFPKGHLEKDETPKEAALREVEEESGFSCVVKAPLSLIRYSFVRKGRRVSKKVRWYWMEPRRKTGSPDAGEIHGMKWLDFGRAKTLLRYPADFRLIDRVSKMSRGERP